MRLPRGRLKKRHSLGRGAYLGAAEVLQLAILGDFSELQAAVAEVADEHANRGSAGDAFDAAGLRCAREPVEQLAGLHIDGIDVGTSLVRGEHDTGRYRFDAMIG